MGVSGTGKSTIGELLSRRLGWPFEEGDTLHPASNIAKMKAGHPLTDADRLPWLEKVAEWVDAQLDHGTGGIVTCSALKRSYREIIDRRGTGVEFVYLRVDRTELERRVENRVGHFMPASLLDSQLATLEEPNDDEPCLTVDAGETASVVVDHIVDALRAKHLD
jgi:carbohydrate kinase (thermoresistant glucokinase family)